MLYARISTLGRVSLAFACACTSALPEPGSEDIISCVEDEQCPSPLLCDVGAERCFDPENIPPSVTVNPARAGRALTVAELELSVSHPTGLQTRIVVEYRRVGDETWTEATAVELVDAAGSTRDLVSVAPGTYTIRWNALSEVRSDSPLASVSVPELTVGQSDCATAPVREVLRFAQVELRVTAIDSRNRSSSPRLTPPLGLGNNRSTIEIEELGPILSGNIPIALSVVDQDLDPASLIVEFQTEFDRPAGRWRRARAAFELPERLTSVAALTGSPQFVFIWDSDAPEDPDPRSPQGIGNTVARNLSLRITGVEIVGGARVCGVTAATPNEISVINQTAPQISDLRVRGAELLASSNPVAISYRLVDAQSDPVDVRCEFSIDSGNTWTLCTEYRTPRSEGFTDLATAPASTEGLGGVAHVLYWDPRGQFLPPTSTAVRLTASDGRALDAMGRPVLAIAQVSTSNPVGATAPTDFVFDLEETLMLSTGNLGALVIPFLDGNEGLDAVAYLDDILGELNVVRWNGSALEVQATTSLPFSVSGASLTPIALDEDGLESVVIGGRFQWQVARRSTAFSLGAAGMGEAGEELRAIATGDLDANGREEVIAVFADSAQRRVDVSFLNLDASVVESTQNLGVSAFSREVACDDLDGDGYDDVVILAGSELHVVWGADVMSTQSMLLAQDILPGARLLAHDFDRDGLAEGGLWTPDGEFEFWSFEARDARLLNTFSIASAGVVSVTPAEVSGDGIDDILLNDQFGLKVITASSVADSEWFGGFFGPGLTRTISTFEYPQAFLADLRGTEIESLFVVRILPSSATELQEWPDKRLEQDFSPSSQPSTELGTRISGISSIALADVDFDGAMDSAVAIDEEVPGALGIAFGATVAGIPDGTFGFGIPYEEFGTIEDLVVGRFSDDPWPDLVVAATESFRVLVTNAPGVPGGSRPFAVGPLVDKGNVKHPLVADLDRDGLDDLVWVDDGNGDTLIYRNASGSGFDPPIVFASLDAVAHGSGDLDADGDRDLVFYDDDGNLGWLENELLSAGALSFASPANLAPSSDTGGRSGSVARVLVRDLNADGILDIIVADLSICVFLGDGTRGTPGGGFSRPNGDCIFTSGDTLRTWSLFAGDFGADGLTDIATAAQATGSGTLRVFIGFADVGSPGVTSTFGLDFNIGTPRPSSFGFAAMRDINADSVPDVVGVDGSLGSVVRYPGRITKGYRPVAYRLQDPERRVGEVLPALTERVAPGLMVGPLDYITIERARTTVAGELDFAHALRRDGVLPSRAVPLSGVWNAIGDVRLTRVVLDGDPAEDRLRVEQRFGPVTGSTVADRARVGLDLDADQPTGIIVTLPLIPSRVAELQPADTIRVYRQRVDWLRASEVAFDPLVDDAEAARYLPKRVAADGTYEDVIAPYTVWDRIEVDTDGDLNTGSGERFVVDLSSSSVSVALDRLGSLQVYFEP